MYTRAALTLMRQATSGFSAFAVSLCLLTAVAAEQDPRGSVAGVVTDTTGAVLPGVTISVINAETGVAQTVVTDLEGRYQVLYLNPGTYSVAAELAGFKKYLATGTRVGVSDVVRVDISLEPGGVAETVTITADSSLLAARSSISGTTVDSRQIAELPLGDGTAYMLTRLAPGIVDTSDLHFSRPADNGNLAGIVANGAQGGNEFSIDGAPNMSNQRGVGFSPPSDAISEFKVQTNAFDAQTGHTAGAVVNLALKSGTNAVHFQGGYFNRDDNRSETPLLTERNNGTKPTREYNRATGTISGPVLKNRTFFMVSFEYLRDVQPEPAAYTVPTVRMRNGDLGEFPTQIFDPMTATGTTGTRTPFANNQIDPGRINAVAAAYARLYPLPNRPGTVANYFTNQLRPYDYNGGVVRIDHNFGANDRIFANTYWNNRQEDRYNWALGAENATGEGVIGDFGVTQGFDYRTNSGATGGYTAVWSPTVVFDLRASWARFGEYRDPGDEFDPALLGFSPTAVSMMNGYQYLPFLTFGTFSTTNSNSTIASRPADEQHSRAVPLPSRSRDAALESSLGQQVPNPFAGLMPGSSFNGANISRMQLLRPYPHFGTFALEEYGGSDRYHGATVQVQKRFSGGNSLTAQYTRSSLRDRLNYLNPADGVLEDRVSPNDRPNRLSLGSVMWLPFGRDQRWGSDWNGVVDAVLGGWQVSGTYQYQSGAPLVWNNSVYYDAACDPLSLRSHIGEDINGGIGGLDVPAWDTSCFYFHDALVQTGGVDDSTRQRNDTRIQMGNNVRYFPSTLPDVRTDNLHLLDIGLSKSFTLPRNMRLQIRMEAINALNYTVLWNPNIDPRNANFGFVNQDRNNPRDIQLGLRFTF